MVTEYIAWTGMPSQVRKYMFISGYSQAFSVRHCTFNITIYRPQLPPPPY